ncbi:immunity 52 family protein [Hyalangium rubrum]|uniref:Immunity 52 family protein n=1 Tax=Hyalangium rubrum TaxID=3103134 RepID=A0ABU5HBJ8_9BACT|nr:immunity 52 family protein [Hyalangium sp. s54d21]MDY7230203.1 immunity 52 family protein [Hyalangium sp. s54d21]
MVDECYYAGAYWGPRREDVGECARRAELFFHMLARCDASLNQWYRRGRVARGLPGHRVRMEHREELEELLLRGRNRATLDKSAIEDLGFSLEVWNQRPAATATNVSVRCGGYTEHVSNACLVDPPSEGEAADRMLHVSPLAQVLECMATAWEPSWGVVNTNLGLDLLPKAQKGAARVGWMTYFARRRGTVPPLPAPVRIEPIGALGTLVILTPERFTVSNPEHLALGRRVHELLDRAGLLKPELS